MNSKSGGILATIIFHLALAILLIMTGFSTPLPLPAEQGILINFGNSDDGDGLLEPTINTQAAAPQHTAPKPTPKAEQTPLTQDFEESASIPVPPKKNNEIKETPKPVEPPKKTAEPVQEQTTEEQTTPEPQPEPQPTVNKKALFPGQKANGSNTGEGETGKPGNQGGLNGSPDSNNRTGSTGGNGNAERGIVANLKGRTASALPKPQYPSQKSGNVVVRVKVDKEGNVIEAVGGQKGSTTTDTELVKAAEKAALNAKFNVSASAPAFQVGEITYVFRLQ